MPLWGQQQDRSDNSHHLCQETFLTPTGTATGFSHRASRRRNGNISYPYGDSNEIPRLNKRILKKHFLPLWGQQHERDNLILDDLNETFHTPMGTATQRLAS